MGRITPSFRQLFMSEVEELRRGFYKALLDPDHRDAFDLLIRAWCSEDTAMSNANIPCVLDNMNLMANVHNQKGIMQLRAQIKEYDEKIQRLEGKFREMQKLAEAQEKVEEPAGL